MNKLDYSSEIVINKLEDISDIFQADILQLSEVISNIGERLNSIAMPEENNMQAKEIGEIIRISKKSD